jgi:hypothetical protein
VTCASPGFGDNVQLSHVRLIAGAEVLNGLADRLVRSVTYLAMDRYWPPT